MDQNTDIIFPENRDKYRYWELEKFTKIFTVVAIILAAAILLIRKQIFLLLLANALIPVICLILDILLPDYFTLLYTKREMLTNEQASRISLLNPFLISAGALAVATKLNLHTSSVTALLIAGGVFAVIGCLLCAGFLAEFRLAKGRKIVAFLLFLVLGLGVTLQTSYWLDCRKPELVGAKVLSVEEIETYGTGGREAMQIVAGELAGVEYICTLELEDGTQARFPLRTTNYVAIGANTVVNRYEGIPFIVCYSLRSNKLNFIQ